MQAAKRSNIGASASLVVAGSMSFLVSMPGVHGLVDVIALMTFSSSIGVQLADVDGEEDALGVVELLGRRTQRVDADDAAALVEQRAAAVAGIDRRRCVG